MTQSTQSTRATRLTTPVVTIARKPRTAFAKLQKFLDRVSLDLAQLHGYRDDDDLMLYLFARLKTVNDHAVAGSSPKATAVMIYRQYQDACEQANYWWNFSGSR